MQDMAFVTRKFKEVDMTHPRLLTNNNKVSLIPSEQYKKLEADGKLFDFYPKVRTFFWGCE